MEEWRTRMKRALDREPGTKGVGKLLLDSELPPGAEPSTSRGGGGLHGDLLPIHPALVVQGLEGITKDNLHWVRFVLVCLDFLYCSAWAKPVCVPMGRTLGANQKVAIQRLGSQVDRLIARKEKLPSAKAAASKLCSKRFDYNGQPVDHMKDLDATKVIKAWPRVASAAVVDLKDCLPPDLAAALDNPRQYLLPEAELPDRHRGSRVRASETEWHKIVRAGYDRGMFVAVDDSEVPTDKRGHLITNGAGAVTKMKKEDGRDVEAQRFISILCPTNDAMRLLPGVQDKLPYIGQLTAVMAEKDSYLVLDSEDLQSAFNLFRMPLEWAPFFSFAQKVRGDALGGSPNTWLRPGLRVVPMGWTSAVTLIQAAIRHIAYSIAKIPPHGDVTMDDELPSSGAYTILYLDNYDEIRHLKKELAEEQAGAPSANHVKFIDACNSLGLPRNEAKQLCGSLTGALQGGEILGESRVLRHSYDKTVELIGLGMGLLVNGTMPEHCLRHWTGKAAFAAAFRRPMYSVLQEVYGVLDSSKAGAHLALPLPVVDEVLVFTGLLALAETDLSSEISGEISCTDASPTGGGCSVATAFKSATLILPDPVVDENLCGCCQREMQEPAWRTYPCSRRCGLRMCSLACSRAHADSCTRKWWHTPAFGERFSGRAFPFTKAVALKGISTQPPLDYDVPGDTWDYRTEDGKARLDEQEADGDLLWSHWSPTRITFLTDRTTGYWDWQGHWVDGATQLRDRRHPEGLPRLKQHLGVSVRQANALAKRAARGLTEANRRGRFASLEHPYYSYLWDLPEVKALQGEGWYHSVFSTCCHGGSRETWLCVLHNSPSLHAVLHRPECPGHDNLELPREDEDEDEFSEYPWALCLVMAEGVYDELNSRYSEPFGSLPLNLDRLLEHQLRGATKGLQQDAAVQWAVSQCASFLEKMEAGEEKEHFKWLLRHAYHTGCDVRLTDRGDDIMGHRPGPYPAFRWLWRDVLSYRWREPQHINVLEMTAFLTELRRRARSTNELGKRFFCILDSLVSFYVLGKGRSSSKRLNRVSRRIASLSLASGLIPMTLWTISKWNYSDGASRKYEPQ
ncbi:unnamed protein product [Symbiodinium sp. CCMP2592]|nr:unnamed protein product [Symbiodinium sp. CCMP2592]